MSNQTYKNRIRVGKSKEVSDFPMDLSELSEQLNISFQNCLRNTSIASKHPSLIEYIVLDLEKYHSKLSKQYAVELFFDITSHCRYHVHSNKNAKKFQIDITEDIYISVYLGSKSKKYTHTVDSLKNIRDYLSRMSKKLSEKIEKEVNITFETFYEINNIDREEKVGIQTETPSSIFTIRLSQSPLVNVHKSSRRK